MVLNRERNAGVLRSSLKINYKQIRYCSTKTKGMIIKILDILRMLIVCITFFFGYRIGFSDGYDPMAQLHFMIPVIILSIAGISGIEGLFLARHLPRTRVSK
jgi:hypothetical protein